MGKKELIVEATKKLILEKGYKNISVEDITNSAGIAKGSFYTYFKSKNLVIDYILNEKIANLKIQTGLEKNLSLSTSIKNIVVERLQLDEEEIRDNLILVNLFRNIASLEISTLNLLKDIEGMMIERFEKIIQFHINEISIKNEDIKFYSKMINSIIANYKTFTLFFSEEENSFIRSIEKVKEKYKSQDFKKNIEIISTSILKILTY